MKKKSLTNILYVVSFSLLIFGVTLIAILESREISEPKFKPVSRGIFDYDKVVKVVNTSDVILRPYKDPNVTLTKEFYDYLGDEESQKKSLIYYEGTYIQSSGVSYSGKDAFDVVAILSGKVKEVKEDSELGGVVIIEHDNGIISEYQSLSDIIVKQGDEVAQGQLIAKSSTSNIRKDLNNHLYFELIINGECVNPENYYDKLVSEIQA